ncbi:MAG: 4-hydroxythreonine-4-phosphate dehydrogenase PdxA [Cyclobacteriaceae bacterium]|nr:4-hydroxythreonine-4-phosphate dehydrogenase PdxA [Cyclobacteriaceae bacterium]
MSSRIQKPKIGITIGDINGIGPEVIIKTLTDNRILSYCTPIIYASTKTLSYYRKLMEANDFNYSQVKKGEHFYSKKVNVVNCWEETIEINPGIPTVESGKSAFLAIKKATADLKKKTIDAIVTAPIDKKNIQNDEFKFAGHTEYFTQQFETKDSLMLLSSDRLRVGVVTEHIPISKVSDKLTKELVTSKISTLVNSLKIDFGINKPKVAVLGLNPHAGENGLIGSEENDIISPAIHDVKNKGNLIYGPFPADGFFGTGQYKKYDGILAMYHDQGLIPFKTLAFDTGVNFTAGLPIIRTSPDHGTAFNIAGKNIADETSLRSAIYQALDIVKNRLELEANTANSIGKVKND